MDANGFDTLTKAIARRGTRRRQVLGSALGGAAVLLGVAGLPVVAAKKGVHGEGPCGNGSVKANRCKRNGQCCTDFCDKKKGNQPYGRCRCRKLSQSCTEDRNCCATAGQPMSCQGNVCVRTDPDPDPVTCTGPTSTGSSATQGLQEAIDGAEDGTTLTLCIGTWNLTETVEIAKSLTLIGAGAGQTVLDGGDAGRVLLVNPGGPVTLRNLTITNGNAEPGGGIHNKGTLTLLGVSVTGNTAPNHGGGIYNDGNLTLQMGSQVTGNTTEFEAAGGAGIYNYGTATLQAGSSVTDNTSAYHAGGIYNDGGTVTLQSGS